jgi:hypothetical protein
MNREFLRRRCTELIVGTGNTTTAYTEEAARDGLLTIGASE